MDRDLAVELAKKYQEFGNWLDAMTDLSTRLTPPQGKVLRRSLAEMTYSLEEGIPLEARKNFPDLFPESYVNI